MSRSVSAGKSRRLKAKHRNADRRIQPYTWLGAGAITVGVSAAMLSNAGIAHAEDSSDGGSTSTSTSTSTATSNNKAESNSNDSDNGGSTQQPGDNLPTSTSAKSNDSHEETAGTSTELTSSSGSSSSGVKVNQPGSPVSTVSASTVVVKSKDETPAEHKEESALAPATAVGEGNQARSQSAPVLHAEEVAEAATSTSTLRASTLGPAALRAASTGEPTPNPGIPTVALVASAAAADPARAAYLKQFKDVDPNGLYFTPASDGYQFVPQSYTDLQYRQFIADQVEKTGTRGFAQTATGSLQYTNSYNQNVAVLYGSKAGGVVEPSGIRIVRPGQTVVLPSGTQGAIASAQLPRTGTQINEAGVAAVGYPPFTRTPQSQPNIITAAVTAIGNTIANGVQAINSALNATIQFANNIVRAITTPPAQQAPVGVGALYDRLRATTGDSDDDGVNVDRVIGGNDGETRYIVYLGGTVPYSLDPNQQNAFRNGDSYAGRLKANQIAAIDRALRGDTGPKKIMLVGYSQGGLDAQNIAASGKYNVTTVITYGAPITKAPPTKYRIVSLEANGDPIPDLSNPIEHFNNFTAGNIYKTGTSTYPNGFALFFTPLILRPVLFVNSVHGPTATYVEAGNKFETAAGFGAVKSNIANFRGRLDKSFN